MNHHVSNGAAVLDSALAYQHPGLVQRLTAKLGVSSEQASELFTDVKRFLYECNKSNISLSPSPQVDEGWHNFILFTKDYADFCHRHFGRFIHHVPLGAAVGRCSGPGDYCTGCSHGQCSGRVF